MNQKKFLEKAKTLTFSTFDDINGGFSKKPKFPTPVHLDFLLRMYKFTKDDEILNKCILTFDKMSNGGIYDHIGGGFHRYSVDSEWHVPHFEKMLYDNAQLAISYTEIFQITGKKKNMKKLLKKF